MEEIPALQLICPEELPRSYDDLRQRMTAQVSSVLELYLSRPRAGSVEDSLCAVGESLRALGEREFPRAERGAPSEVADPDSHDQYCRILRVVDSESLHVFVGAVLRAYEELLEDAIKGGSSLMPEQGGALRASFECLLDLCGGSKAAAIAWAGKQYFELPRTGLLELNPLHRWIRGHHVFLVLIQGLIVALNCFESAHREGAKEDCFSALELATLLMNGSSAALHYAGDFPSDVYDETVRPTMMPPNVLPGMSGVLARDHCHLVKLLHSHRSLFKTLEPELKQPYHDFVAAFACAYDAHKVVCAHFRGGERPSLLNGNTGHSGVELLEELKATRTKGYGLAERAVKA